MKIVIATLLASSLAACGTVTRGTTDQVTFDSKPQGASVQTSAGLACATPCTLEFSRKQEFIATLMKDGYEPQSVPVKTKLSGGGAAGVAGNALLGGIIGVGVDLATGAALDHYPNPVFVDFEAPENTSKPLPQRQPEKNTPKGPQPPRPRVTPVS